MASYVYIKILESWPSRYCIGQSPGSSSRQAD